jgi:hypothetical protein
MPGVHLFQGSTPGVGGVTPDVGQFWGWTPSFAAQEANVNAGSLGFSPAQFGPGGPLASMVYGPGGPEVWDATAIGGANNWTNIESEIAALNNNLGNQFLAEYESGQIPIGQATAIQQSFTTGETALASQLAAEGLDVTTSSQFTGGVEKLAEQRSIAVQAALDQVLQQYFQAQGMSLQAAGLLQQYSEFEQNLVLEYAKLSAQIQEASNQSQQAGKGQMAGMAGQVGQMLGGLGGKAIALGVLDAMAKVIGLS